MAYQVQMKMSLATVSGHFARLNLLYRHSACYDIYFHVLCKSFKLFTFSEDLVISTYSLLCLEARNNSNSIIGKHNFLSLL